MEPFTAAPHHDVLALLVQLAILLFAARALGELAQRLGQPSVVGELMAGILLGPSLLSSLFPVLGTWIVPHTATQGHLLEVVALLGAMFLLLITGLETDVAVIRRHARTALGASIGGIILPMISGFAIGWYLPEELLVDPDQRIVFALFLATALSISAVPVIAKVLMDMGLMRRDVGQTILAAGILGDAIGWMLLSVVVGLAAGDAITAWGIGGVVLRLGLFAVGTFTVGRWFVRRALDFVQDEARSRDRTLTLVFVLMCVWAAITQALGLEAVLGAFAVGMLFSLMPRLPVEVVHKLESVSMGIFAPIFFAVAGLKVNIQHLLTPQLAITAVVLITVATIAKVVGTYVGARLIGRRDHWTALAMGGGMNARGAMEIIIATIGLSLGILSQDIFSIVVLDAMVTSLAAPPALRWALAHVVPEQQELERLKQEELAKDSLIAQVRRVLVPVRRRPGTQPVHRLEAHIIERLGEKAPISVTLLNVADAADKAAGAAFLDQLASDFEGADVAKKVVVSTAATDAILDEAAKNYQLLILGGTEGDGRTDALFHPMVDAMVRLAPCPTLVVRAPAELHGPPKRILVPTNGSVPSQHAADLAFLLATGADEEVLVLTAASVPDVLARVVPANPLRRRELEARRQIVRAIAERGEAQGARVRTVVETGEAETVIVDTARKEGADLIVLGTDVRPGTDRLFLGPRVERILRDAPCPVVVVNAG